ncbi:MAG: DNA polymerase III subunit alpha, partial [Cytophagales bacterium]|nr:DNA polymerase III subunit alpha [Cytophagales bacterium]
NDLEDMYDEIELLGFTLNSPFQLLKSIPVGIISASELNTHIGKQVEVVGYLITIKYTRTGGGNQMYFGTFVDQAGEFIDTVHFPPVAKQFPFTGRGIYHIRGKIVEDFGAMSLEVDKMTKLGYRNLE